MSTTKVIYTIGHLPHVTFPYFLNNLKKFGINSVVDIRRMPNSDSYGQFSTNNIKTILNSNGIYYLPFCNEFGWFEQDVCDSKGTPVYDKVIASDNFIRGIERLEGGSTKGFTIAILNFSVNPSNCVRFNLIGRYLADQDWTVYHILEDGNAVLQTILEEKLNISKERSLQRRVRSAELGRIGEELAAEYLMRNGYTILDSNWNLHRGCELDIVAFKDNKIHAVEVKTRSNDNIISPEQAINDRKLKNIIKALNTYRYEKHLMNIDTQIDSIAIVMKSSNDFTIKMYEDLIRRFTWMY